MSLPGRFDFGLSAAEEARAATLHRDSIVFDMVARLAGPALFEHYPAALQKELRNRIDAARSTADVLAEAIYWPLEMARLERSDLIRPWLAQSGLTCGAYDMALHLDQTRADALGWDWDERLRRCAQLPWIKPATRAAHIRQAKQDGALALYAFCQPIVAAARDLKPFDVAYEKGLRAFMLTYNRMDHIGVGCTERVDAGLSMFGIEVVAHLNRLGMMVDVSHCGPLTTLDACRHSSRPVTANHTAARGLHDHARGKSDEALQAIAGTGGFIGVVAVPSFLTAEPTATIEHLLDHIDYIAERVGWQHVGLGTDWPWPVPHQVLIDAVGIAPPKAMGFRPQDRIDRRRTLAGYADCRDLPNITRGLIKRGYRDEQIQGILGENALRVFESVCG